MTSSFLSEEQLNNLLSRAMEVDSLKIDQIPFSEVQQPIKTLLGSDIDALKGVRITLDYFGILLTREDVVDLSKVSDLLKKISEGAVVWEEFYSTITQYPDLVVILQIFDKPKARLGAYLAMKVVL